MTFFFAELSRQIDWSKRPRWRDKELAGISLGSTPDSMVADKLVEVFLHDGRAHWVLIHIEVQAQRTFSFASRVLDYNYRIFKEYRQPVASLVLLADEDPDWRPCAFHNDVLGTVMGISFPAAKLLDYANCENALLASRNPFAWVALAHLRTQQSRHDPQQLYAAKWQLTKLLFERKWSKRRIIVLFKAINWMMALPDQLQHQYWRAVLDLEKEKNMRYMECLEWVTPLEQTFMDKGRKEGLEKGIEQGIEQGRKEGAVAMLERQLTRRFGPLSATVQRKLAKASLTTLQAWSDALPEAESLKQVFASATTTTTTA